MGLTDCCSDGHRLKWFCVLCMNLGTKSYIVREFMSYSTLITKMPLKIFLSSAYEPTVYHSVLWFFCYMCSLGKSGGVAFGWCVCVCIVLYLYFFPQDWWNSTSYSNYYRTWNVVVHDWLYYYAYKDFLWVSSKI